MTHAVKDEGPIKGFDPRDVRLTADEFLNWESPDGKRYELEGGQLIMHAAPAAPHGRMIANMTFLVMQGLNRSRPNSSCGPVVPANLKSAIEDDDTVFEPDLVITCEPNINNVDVKEPQVVVEFVSPKQGEKRDQAKIPFYQAIPSVHTIILVYTLQIRVDIWRRTSVGWTTAAEKLDIEGVIKIPQLELEIPVHDLYLNTPLG